eukprot:CAMPEP_0174371002 /NCGR_PEP_ID=MMETSP0811_2-20130205/98179_1 /TAXON_ID=73025 ORGANISM="Eutreptiella gymnastica-like, Strain CCMP1594" /NCGR_SAMPLE_ID=MMETSP0811_2 /ASSEMBLY_ACC=CAM_ASM_000667 /LENGTH=104 /DNA_ID=CAMNT_0015516975 /DNA_START=750 /DNA_END=1061 /DNA_ORIENTATION=+
MLWVSDADSRFPHQWHEHLNAAGQTQSCLVSPSVSLALQGVPVGPVLCSRLGGGTGIMVQKVAAQPIPTGDQSSAVGIRHGAVLPVSPGMDPAPTLLRAPKRQN